MSTHPDTTLADVLERVPPLLHSCASRFVVKRKFLQEEMRHAAVCPLQARRSAIAQIRLICKQASRAGMQLVSGFCLTLPSVEQPPSAQVTKPQQCEADFLSPAKLQRLRVEVDLPQGETQVLHAPACMFASMSEQTQSVYMLAH